jgi:hypothetical protein
VLLPAFLVHAESFKPPQLGAPEARIGGGTRGIKIPDSSKQAHNIQLLATKKIGLSSSATPTLYWYAPKSSSGNVTLTVRLNENEPLLEKNIGTIKKAGIQTVDLADYGVSLVAGQDYTWSINTVGSAKQEAHALIRYVVPATPLTDAAQMTKEGYWYDAVAQLIKTKSPHTTEFLQHEGINIRMGK